MLLGERIYWGTVLLGEQFIGSNIIVAAGEGGEKEVFSVSSLKIKGLKGIIKGIGPNVLFLLGENEKQTREKPAH